MANFVCWTKIPVANSPPPNPKLESIKEESELVDGLAAIQVDECETDGQRLMCNVVSRTTVSWAVRVSEDALWAV